MYLASKATSQGGYSSRISFWSAAIGATVGYSNVCWFPNLMLLHGGLAFLIPYLTVTLTLVMPMLLLEFGIAQVSGANCVGASASAGSTRIRSVGLQFAVSIASCLSYPLVVCWSLVYFANSFKGVPPWSDPSGTDIIKKARTFYQSPAGAYAEPDFVLEGISWRILLAGVATWALVFVQVFRGPKFLGNIATLTQTMSCILIAAITCSTVAFDGSHAAVAQFMRPDFSRICKLDAWSDALGQSLYSVNVASGTMMALAKHNPRRQNFVTDAMVVVGVDTAYAVLSCVVMFASCGLLSKQTGVPLGELPLDAYDMTFIVYPAGISSLGFPWAQINCSMYFLLLSLLGLNSMAGFVQSLVDVLFESRCFRSRFPLSRQRSVSAVVSVLFFPWHLILSSDIGTHLMTVMDHFNGKVLVQFFCLAEALCFGFLYLKEEVVSQVGGFAQWTLFLSVSLVPFAGFWAAVHSAGSAWYGFVLGTLALSVAMALLAFVLVKSPLPAGERAWWLYVGNLERLRYNFNYLACPGYARLPRVWCLCVKLVTPVALCFILARTISSPDAPFGKSYPFWMLAIGAAFSIIGPLLFLVSCVSPHLMRPLILDSIDFSLLARPFFGLDAKLLTPTQCTSDVPPRSQHVTV